MKAVIITNSTNYEPRAEKVGLFLQRHGHQVMWLETNFNHMEKAKKKRKLADHHYIDTVPYKKNMSIQRMYSQYDFSRKVFRILKDEDIDLLYVLIPANSLTPVAARLKARLQAKVVVDIIDLWPESLPFKGLEGFWPVQYWRKLRDDYLKEADLVITECELYQKILHLSRGTRKSKAAVTMYWPKETEAEGEPVFQPDRYYLHVVYLGSINNIIDMELIIEILNKVNQKKKIILHIIGDGEKRDVFLKELEEHSILIEYHGVIYKEEEKKRIFEICSFGINIMKDSVCVGLTMKSIDYFCYGVPMINSIQGDTWRLIEDYGIGVNCDRKDADKCAEKIIESAEKIQQKRGIIRELYRRLFTREAMEEVLCREVLPLLEKEI